MSDEKHNEQPRHHSEQPAEGKPSQNPSDTGIHPQAPAEGADPDDESDEPGK
jgi:hypothetical protein